MLCKLTGSPTEIFIIIFLILGSIFWIVVAYGYLKSIDDYFDTPKFDIPDELTIEIVKETPEHQEVSQTSPSMQPSSASESLPCSTMCPTHKDHYVPE